MTCSLLSLVPQPNITWTRPQVLLVTHSSFFCLFFWEGGFKENMSHRILSSVIDLLQDNPLTPICWSHDKNHFAKSGHSHVLGSETHCRNTFLNYIINKNCVCPWIHAWVHAESEHCNSTYNTTEASVWPFLASSKWHYKNCCSFLFFSLVSHWLVTVCHQWNVCIHMSTRATDSVLSIRGWMLRTACLSTYPCSYFSCVVLFILSC